MARDTELIIENATLIYKNFAGRERQFNAAGDRNFSVRIDNPDEARALQDDGWNVKFKQPRTEEEEGFYHLPVSVNYRFIAPTVYLVAEGVRTIMDEDSIDILDWTQYESVDLIIRAYDWKLATGASGRKAELKKMFMNILVDDLDRKYGVFDGA